MTPAERRAQLEAITDQIHAHADMMEQKQYGSREDFQRDMAIGIELGNQYTDLLGDIVDNDFPLADYVTLFER